MKPADSSWYFSRGGQNFGPVSAETIQAMVRSNQLEPEDTVRHTTWPYWFTIAEAAETLGIDVASPTQSERSGTDEVTGDAPKPSQVMPPETGVLGAARLDSPPSAPPTSTPPPSTPAPSAPLRSAPPPSTSFPTVPEALAGQDTGDNSPNTGGKATSNPAATPMIAGPSGAGLLIRGVSWGIDLIVLATVLLITNSLFTAVAAVPSMIVVVFIALYLIVLPSFGIGTIGHVICGLRVIDAETGQPARRSAIRARGAITILLVVPLGVGVIASIAAAARNPAHRTWPDAATNTVVRRR